jgi:hypothetical protein
MWLLIAALCAAVSEQDLKDFALREARPRVDEILKSPSTASYGVKSVAKVPDATALVPNRYLVRGHVEVPAPGTDPLMAGGR